MAKRGRKKPSPLGPEVYFFFGTVWSLASEYCDLERSLGGGGIQDLRFESRVAKKVCQRVRKMYDYGERHRLARKVLSSGLGAFSKAYPKQKEYLFIAHLVGEALKILSVM